MIAPWLTKWYERACLQLTKQLSHPGKGLGVVLNEYAQLKQEECRRKQMLQPHCASVLAKTVKNLETLLEDYAYFRASQVLTPRPSPTSSPRNTNQSPPTIQTSKAPSPPPPQPFRQPSSQLLPVATLDVPRQTQQSPAIKSNATQKRPLPSEVNPVAKKLRYESEAGMNDAI